MSIDSSQKPVLDFKLSSVSVPTLILTSSQLADIERALREKMTQAPSLFKNSSVLIDLKLLQKQSVDIDLRAVVNLLRQLDFLPIGLHGGTDQQNVIALKLGIPVQTLHTIATQSRASTRSEESTIDTANPEFETNSSTQIENKLITTPVRSGQRIYARGDLTILAAVNPGAEVMAEGNIHVYAPLRGRALAGVRGNIHSCIFCSNLQAELISIAGTYQLSDALMPNKAHKLVQIYLQGQSLLIKDL
jgi:septum site-determining protein MinC